MKLMMRMCALGALVLLCLVSTVACSSSSVCGDGEAVTVDGALYCAVAENIVIETGFECPSAASFRYRGPGGDICAPRELDVGSLPSRVCMALGAPSCDMFRRLEPSMNQMPAVGMQTSLTVGGSSAVNSDGAVVWIVTSGSPDYQFLFGRFQASDGSFRLRFDRAPPAEALNDGVLGVGTLIASSTFDLTQFPEGRQASGESVRVEDNDAGTALSCRYAIIFVQSGLSSILSSEDDWPSNFPLGYSCGEVVPAQEGQTFDTFEPVNCGDMQLETGCSGPNWT